MSKVYYDYLQTPIGRLMLAADARGLLHIDFENGKYPTAIGAHWERCSAALHEARAQLNAYFAGTLTVFDLPLAPQGTPFQQRVWLALLVIGYAATSTYAEIARALGDGNATRAVGAANGRNPLPIIIPCHRVIGTARSNKAGSLTGFGGGLPTKRWLLDHEQRHGAFTLT